MIIHILFTCNAHKDNSSRCLRGVFTDMGSVEEAQHTLLRNEVPDVRDRQEDEDEEDYLNEVMNDGFDIVSIEENEFEADGGYY